MEHSYSRDTRRRPMEGAPVITTKTIMVRRAPQCTLCHCTDDEEIDVVDVGYKIPQMPPYNEYAAKLTMEEFGKDDCSDDYNWVDRIKKNCWTKLEHTLFDVVTNILDRDHIERLANRCRSHEPAVRRSIIEKSVASIRKVLQKVRFTPKLLQWLHGLLMDNLSPSYMAGYLDILQTLKSKEPVLADAMMFGRPINQDILGLVSKRAWEPQLTPKSRILPGNAVIVIVPSNPLLAAPTSRQQSWYTLLSSMANVIPIQMTVVGKIMKHHPIQTVTEQIIAVSRAKIQEIRNESANRHIILVGFNAGAEVALQAALVENVNSVVCLGFDFNALNGVCGQRDDKILDLTTPVMFVLGQNSAHSSQEEMEWLRDNIQARMSLVVVESADDALSIVQDKRQIEGVTQTMIDNMIMDEISEFASACIINPQAPKYLINENIPMLQTNCGHVLSTANNKSEISSTLGHVTKRIKIDSEATKSFIIRTKDGVYKSVVPPRKDNERRVYMPHISKRKAEQNAQYRPSTTIVGHSRTHPQPSSPKQMILESILRINQTTIKELKASEITTSYTTLTNVVPTTTSKLDIRTVPTSSIQSSVSSTCTRSIPLNIEQQMKNVKVVPPSQLNKLSTSKSKLLSLKPRPSIKQQNNPPLQYTVRSQSSTEICQFEKSTIQPYKLSSGEGPQILPSVQVTPQTKTTIAQNPTKFTIVNPSAGTSTSQINKIITTSATSTTNKLESEISKTDILDMPILFADNDGNLEENDANPEVSSPSQSNRIIFNSVNPFKATTPISTPMLNKMITLNRSGPVKAVTTPPGSIQCFQPLPAGCNIEIVNNKIVKLTPNYTTSCDVQQAKFKPIVVNDSSVDSDKTTVKNIIRVDDTQIKRPNTVVLKPITKGFPILNHRNETVRKMIHLIPLKQVASGGTEMEMIVVPKSTEE